LDIKRVSKCGSSVETKKKDIKMENITVNIKAKMDMVTSDMEEITSQMEDLDWRVQECQMLVNDLEEIKDLLEKLGKALGVQLV